MTRKKNIVIALALMAATFVALGVADTSDRRQRQELLVEQAKENMRRHEMLDVTQHEFLEAVGPTPRQLLDSGGGTLAFPVSEASDRVRLRLRVENGPSAGCSIEAAVYGDVQGRIVWIRPLTLQCAGKPPQRVAGDIRSANGRLLEAELVDESSLLSKRPPVLRLQPGVKLAAWLV